MASLVLPGRDSTPGWRKSSGSGPNAVARIDCTSVWGYEVSGMGGWQPGARYCKYGVQMLPEEGGSCSSSIVREYVQYSTVQYSTVVYIECNDGDQRERR